jgi:hypothetical protein
MCNPCGQQAKTEILAKWFKAVAHARPLTGTQKP